MIKPNATDSNKERDKGHQHFVDSLSSGERMLIRIRDELYEGSWKLMLEDLRRRLEGKVYIFRLVNKIEQDIGGIQKLQRYEDEQKTNLNRYI